MADEIDDDLGVEVLCDLEDPRDGQEEVHHDGQEEAHHDGQEVDHHDGRVDGCHLCNLDEEDDSLKVGCVKVEDDLVEVEKGEV